MPSTGTLGIRSLNGVQVKVFKDQEKEKLGDKAVGFSSLSTVEFLKIVVGIRVKGKKIEQGKG